MSTNDVREVIIIGGGPAAYAAALYSARANLNPLVIEGFAWGGQLMITSDVENYPGYPDGVLGPEMMQDLRRQAERFGTEFLTDDVTKVDLSERPFKVWVGDDEYRAESVIVATGANARQLGLDSEKRLQGRGVSYCAVCDAAFFKDREIVVVGGGDSAMEEATFLAKFASKVTVVHRREIFRASPIMVDRARSNEKIEFMLDSVVEKIRGDDSVTSVVVRNVKTGGRLLRRHRARSDHGALPRPAGHGRGRLHRDQGQDNRDQRRGRLRGGRRAGSRLPPGGHGSRIGLYGRARRGAVPRRAGRPRRSGARRSA